MMLFVNNLRASVLSCHDKTQNPREMKAIFTALIGASFLFACQQNAENRSDTADSTAQRQAGVPDAEQKHCFIRFDGDQQQDSSFLQLVVRGQAVSGTYNYIPHEKDARRGTVLGTAVDDTLDLVWTFKQEGVQDTMRVVFLLENEKLLRKSLSVDATTGRQVTLDSSKFSEIYERIDCLQ